MARRLRTLAGVTAAAVAFQRWSEARDRRRYPAPGSMADVGGGRRLHYVRAGQGAPAIVIETGSGALALGWKEIVDRLSDTTSVVAYDRAGYGWSDPRPLRPRTGDDVAADLHTLLVGAGIPGPYVLVGHSLGGLYVRAFADCYRDDVAGLVLVDASHHDLPARVRKRFGAKAIVAQVAISLVFVAFPRALLRTGVALGTLRGTVRSLVGGDDDELDLRAALYLTSRFRRASLTELLGMRRTMHALARAGSLGDLPVAVVTAAAPAEDDRSFTARFRGEWLELQQDLAALSTNSTHLTAAAGGHFVQQDDPDVVEKAIRWVLDAADA